jgi:hypothetical protein
LRPLLTGWDRVRSMHRIELRRFDRDEVAAQLDAILARRSEPALVDLVCDRSGGNAFLVKELAGSCAPEATRPTCRPRCGTSC